MVLVSDKPGTILVFYKLNSAIERGTKPDALGCKPCHIPPDLVVGRLSWALISSRLPLMRSGSSLREDATPDSGGSKP